MAGRILGMISCNYNDDSFGQLTAVRSVASMPFGGRYRLLDFALSNMVNSGIRTIGVVTPYQYRSILDHVGAVIRPQTWRPVSVARLHLWPKGSALQFYAA